MSRVRVKEVVQYGGHSLAASGSVNLTLKARYSELVNTIQSMQMLNNDVSIKAKLPGASVKTLKLGVFRIKGITIDGDGESTLKFNSISDSVEMDNLNILPNNNDTDKEFAVMLEADIEEEEEEDDEE